MDFLRYPNPLFFGGFRDGQGCRAGVIGGSKAISIYVRFNAYISLTLLSHTTGAYNCTWLEPNTQLISSLIFPASPATRPITSHNEPFFLSTYTIILHSIFFCSRKAKVLGLRFPHDACAHPLQLRLQEQPTFRYIHRLISALTYLLIGPEKIWGLATGFFRDLVLTSSLSAWPDWLPSFLFNGLFGFCYPPKLLAHMWFSPPLCFFYLQLLCSSPPLLLFPFNLCLYSQTTFAPFRPRSAA
jgi:hypothetical protein